MRGRWSARPRSQSNGACGANFSHSRGDPCRRAIRPFEASKTAVRLVRNTSTPAGRFAQIAVVAGRFCERTKSTHC